VVEVDVVQVIVVLVGAAPHEVRTKRAADKIKRERYFTAPLSLQSEIPNTFDSASTMIPNS
jgi:hypothetical protein